MLQNAYFLAKIGADTAENEQHFAEILPIGRRVADRRGPVDEIDQEARGESAACAGKSASWMARSGSSGPEEVFDDRSYMNFASGAP